MRDRAGLLLLLALAAGGLAAFLAFGFLRSPSAPAAVQRIENPSVPVVVAARDLNVGTTLTPEDVKVVDWPATALPDGFASSAPEVVGLGVMVPVYTNEPLLTHKMAGADHGRGLVMLVPEGFRAVSVPVNDVVAVAGWVRPGTRVDVLVTLDQVRTEQEPVTQVVLQNVQVLGNDREIARDERGEAVPIAVVTMLLTPGDTEKLTMAQSNGRLHFALRSPLDLDTVQTPGVRLSGLLTRAPAPVVVRSGAPAPPPAPRRRTVEVIHGQQRSEAEVQRGGGE